MARDLIPAGKHDLTRARAVTGLSFDEVQPVIAELLTWVQDMNWPVAGVLAPWLSSLGAPLAPYIRDVLNGDDEVWKYWLIGSVVSGSPALREELRPELTRIAGEPTEGERREEVDVQAQALLTSGHQGNG